MQAILFYLVGYTLTSIVAFGVLMWVENEKATNLQLDDVSGLAKAHPWAAIAMAVAMFSFAGMPPTVGFMAKFFIFNAAIGAKFYGLVLVGVLGSAISLFYYLRVLVRMFMMPSPSTEVLAPRPSRLTAAVLAVAIVLTLLLGTVLPEMGLKGLGPVVAELVIEKPAL